MSNEILQGNVKIDKLKYVNIRFKAECYFECLVLLSDKSIEKIKSLIGKNKWIGSALKNASEDSFNLLVDYITGNVTHVVVTGYEPEIIPMEKFKQMYDGKLRLLSFFGKDDGSFTYAMGDYYDYSGSSKSFKPFTSYDAAFDFFKQMVLKLDVTERSLKIAGTIYE